MIGEIETTLLRGPGCLSPSCTSHWEPSVATYNIHDVANEVLGLPCLPPKGSTTDWDAPRVKSASQFRQAGSRAREEALETPGGRRQVIVSLEESEETSHVLM